MYKKALVALSIFIVLFVGAWFINEQTKREYYMNNGDDTQTFQIQQGQETEIGDRREGLRIFPAFMSREYIRVDR